MLAISSGFLFAAFFSSVQPLIISNINGHVPDSCAASLIPNPAAQGGTVCTQSTQLLATVSVLSSASSNTVLVVAGVALPSGFMLGIPNPSSAATCDVQSSLPATSLTASSATFNPTSAWLASMYQGAGPVDLCWSSSNYTGSWAYTGIQWQVVVPCSGGCTCCQGTGVSQCLPSAADACCAAAVLPPGQLCCDPALGIAGLALGPTAFSVANVVPFGTPFTITFTGCGLSTEDAYVFVPVGTQCNTAALGVGPQGTAGPLVAQLQYNGVTASPGTYTVCYRYSGAWTTLPGQLLVAGPSTFATTPSPPVAGQPFALTVQGLELSLADGMFWIPGGGGTCGSVTGPQLVTAANISRTSASFGPLTLPQGAETLCYVYNGSTITLSPNLTVYPGPTIAGVYAPSLVNAAGTLLASTCLVARAGYAPLVAGRITLGGAAGTLTAAVSFVAQVPAQVNPTPPYTVVNPVYGCATVTIPASLPIGTCFSFLMAQATDAGGNTATLNSTAAPFCTRTITPPTLQQLTFTTGFVLIAGPTQAALLSANITSGSVGGFATATGLLAGPGGTSLTFTVTGGTALDNFTIVNYSLPFPASTASGAYNLTAFSIQDTAFNYMTYNQQQLQSLPGAVLTVVVCRATDQICAPYVCPGCGTGQCVTQGAAHYCLCPANYETPNASSLAALCAACLPLFTGPQCQAVVTNSTLAVVPDGSTAAFASAVALAQPIAFASGPGQLGTTVTATGTLTLAGPVNVSTPLTLTGDAFALDSVQLLAGGALALPSPGTAVTLENATVTAPTVVTGAGFLTVAALLTTNASLQLLCPFRLAPGATLAVQGGAVHVAGPAVLAGYLTLAPTTGLLVYAPAGCNGLTTLNASLASAVQFLAGASALSNAQLSAPTSIGPLPSGPPALPALLPASSAPPTVTFNSSQLGSLAITSGTGAFACGALATSYNQLAVGPAGTLEIVGIGGGPRANATVPQLFNSPALQLTASTYLLNASSAIPDDGRVITFPIYTPAMSFTSLAVAVAVTHPRITDLVIALVAPDGDRVVLFQKAAGIGANLNTNFSDTAPASVASTPANFIGTTPALRPVGNLSTITSPQPGGQWVLQVQDTRIGGVGNFTSWGLYFLSNATTAAASCQYGGQLHLVPDTAYTPLANDSFVLVLCTSALGTFEKVTHEFGELTPTVVSYSPNLVVTLLGSAVTLTPTPTPPGPVDVPGAPLSPAADLALAVGIALLCVVLLAACLLLVLWQSRLMTNGIDSLLKWYPTRYVGTGDGPVVIQYGAPADDADEKLPEDLELPVPAVPPSRWRADGFAPLPPDPDPAAPSRPERLH